MTMLKPKFISNKQPYLEHKIYERKKARDILATQEAEKPNTVSFYMTLLGLILIFTILAYFREG